MRRARAALLYVYDPDLGGRTQVDKLGLRYGKNLLRHAIPCDGLHTSYWNLEHDGCCPGPGCEVLLHGCRRRSDIASSPLAFFACSSAESRGTVINAINFPSVDYGVVTNVEVATHVLWSPGSYRVAIFLSLERKLLRFTAMHGHDGTAADLIRDPPEKARWSHRAARWPCTAPCPSHRWKTSTAWGFRHFDQAAKDEVVRGPPSYR